MKPSRATNTTDTLGRLWPACAGGATVLMAATVMVGWVARIPLVVQVYPTWVPMQFNTALAMMISAVGLLALTGRVRWLGLVCGLSVGTLAVATLGQYVAGVDLGIDKLLVKSYISVQSSNPGRMAANTAINFLLTSATLICIAVPKARRAYRVAAAYLSSLTILLSAVAILGFFLRLDSAYAWGVSWSEMAVHTAGGFLLVQSGLLTWLLRVKAKQGKQKVTLWTPGLVGMGSLVMVLLGWQELARSHRQQFRDNTEQVAQEVTNAIALKFEARQLALRRMADRWATSGGTRRRAWERDAILYFEDFPGFQAIEWVDPTYHVRWIVPLMGNEQAQNLNLAFEPRRRIMLEKARNKRTRTTTAPVDLVQGGQGFLVYTPIYQGDDFGGFVLGVFRIKPLLREILNDSVAPDYDIEVFHGRSLLYRRHPQPSAPDLTYKAQRPIRIDDVTWQVRVTPSPETVPGAITPTELFLLIGGVILSGFLTGTTQLLATAKQQGAMLTRMNDQMTREIAGRRQYEAALRETQQRLELAIDGSQDGLWDWPNINEDREWWSPRFYELLGYKNDQITASLNAFQELLDPADRQRTFDAVNACFEDDTPFDIEYRLRTNDGAYRWFHARGILVRDDDGKPVRMAGSIQDIHDRKLAQEKFRLVVEASPNALVAVDEQGRITLVNRRVEEWFGYAREAMIGQSIQTLVPERFRDSHPAHITTYFQNPLARPMGNGHDLYAQRKDGSEFPVEIGLAPIQTETGPMVLASIVDITQRKQAEDEIKAKNKDLETLLYVSSHDLREPLRAIQNFSSIVLEEATDRLDDQSLDYVKRVIRAADRMDRLFGDILTLSRAQRAHANTQRVRLSEVTQDVIDQLVDRIQETQAAIQVQSNLPEVIGDRRWITQAVYNLVTNALKFTSPGRAPEVDICNYNGSSGQPEMMGLVVRDRGPGVAPDQESRIFTLFQRAVGRQVEGTGAGLAIVQQVALRHGGQVWVQPRDGGGSEFIITFPTPRDPGDATDA